MATVNFDYGLERCITALKEMAAADIGEGCELDVYAVHVDGATGGWTFGAYLNDEPKLLRVNSQGMVDMEGGSLKTSEEVAGD